MRRRFENVGVFNFRNIILVITIGYFLIKVMEMVKEPNNALSLANHADDDTPGTVSLLAMLHHAINLPLRQTSLLARQNTINRISQKASRERLHQTLTLLRQVERSVMSVAKIRLGNPCDGPMILAPECDAVIQTQGGLSAIGARNTAYKAKHMHDMRTHTDMIQNELVTVVKIGMALLEGYNTKKIKHISEYCLQYIQMISVEMVTEAYGAAACGEMNFLARLQLLRMNKLSDYNIESVAVWFKGEDEISKSLGGHQFLVFNMNPKRNLKDLSTWGDEAIIFDPWNYQIVAVKKVLKHAGWPKYRIYTCPLKMQSELVVKKPLIQDPMLHMIFNSILTKIKKSAALIRKQYVPEKRLQLSESQQEHQTGTGNSYG